MCNQTNTKCTGFVKGVFQWNEELCTTNQTSPGGPISSGRENTEEEEKGKKVKLGPLAGAPKAIPSFEIHKLFGASSFLFL